MGANDWVQNPGNRCKCNISNLRQSRRTRAAIKTTQSESPASQLHVHVVFMAALVRHVARKSFPGNVYLSGGPLIGRALPGQESVFFAKNKFIATKGSMDSKWSVPGPDRTFFVSLLPGNVWSEACLTPATVPEQLAHECCFYSLFQSAKAQLTL